jgi:HrpA-like RNA helicase
MTKDHVTFSCSPPASATSATSSRRSAIISARVPPTCAGRTPIEIVPLFARLSAKEQHRVFEPHTHQRIVIATNVAETSLTVPGIRYVVDPGTARISRYSKQAKVQRLPIEPISQASADQRSGRCGRIADGIAIRLYSSEDYESRPAFHRAGDSTHVARRGRAAHALGGRGEDGGGHHRFRIHRPA